MKLSDPTIRKYLLKRLMSQTVKPRAIIEELRVHNGNAIADIVCLYKESHCYEIKSDLDDLTRISGQSQYYNGSFAKISLVTTEKHLSKSLEKIPTHWGIMLAKNSGDSIVFNYIRKANSNPEYQKNMALLTLWKSEMLELVPCNKSKYQKYSREILAKHLSNTNGRYQVSQNITAVLIKRKTNFF